MKKLILITVMGLFLGVAANAKTPSKKQAVPQQRVEMHHVPSQHAHKPAKAHCHKPAPHTMTNKVVVPCHSVACVPLLHHHHHHHPVVVFVR